MSRSRARRTTAIAIFRDRRFAASTAISATRPTAPNCISMSAPPTTSSARPPPRRRELLEQSWSSVYTTPQSSRNEVGYVNATANVDVSPTWTLQGAAHVRSFYQTTVDGNSTDAQPCADPALLCFNDAVDAANGLNGQQLANPFPAGATLGEIDRTMDADHQRRDDLAGDQHGQTVRPRQSFRDRRQLRLRRHQFRRQRRTRRRAARLFRLRFRDFPRSLGQSGLRRPGLAAHDQCLYRPLRARHVRRHQGLLDFRRRPAECRQHPIAGSTRRRAQRRRYVHALQSDDRRDLQDQFRCHGLRRLFRGQSRADAAGARLRRSGPTLHRRELPRLRSAAEAGRRAHLRSGIARDARLWRRRRDARLEARRVADRQPGRHSQRARSRSAGLRLFPERRRDAAARRRDGGQFQGRQVQRSTRAMPMSTRPSSMR